MDDQVQIKERSKTYDIKLAYHSDLMCQNYDAEISASANSEGRITLRPPTQWDILGPANSFVFDHSDPDRVIAIARMMLSFAEMIKNENKKTIDISKNV